MIELPNGHEASDDIESLIKSACDYVRPSDDLRPRVLEVARAERQERRVQRNLARMAAVVFLMVTVISVYRQPGSAGGGLRFSPTVEAVSMEAEAIARSADPSWEMVESFTDLRRRQAEWLRL